MTAWDVSSRLLLAVALAAVVVSCYDAPKPDCGFRCGPAGACPTDYTCAADGRCRLYSASPDLVCPTFDASLPADAYSPAVIFTSPGSGVTVNPSSTVRVTFDVDVTGVNAATFKVTTSAAAVAGNVLYDPGTRQAIFTGTEGLPPNEQLMVSLTAEITDPVSGRPLMPTTFMFRTSQDTTAPMVVSTNPSNNATGVSVGAPVTFRFSEPVVGINSSTVTLFETGSSQIIGTVTYAAATRTATFDPLDQLTPNLNYMGRINAGITDLAGNALAAPVITAFMTGPDTVAPNVRFTAPANMDTNVAVASDIVVTFDEPVAGVTITSFQVNGGAVAGTVTISPGNRTATFDPTSNLPAASTINVTLSAAINDTSGNALAAFAFTFTTM